MKLRANEMDKRSITAVFPPHSSSAVSHCIVGAIETVVGLRANCVAISTTIKKSLNMRNHLKLLHVQVTL